MKKAFLALLLILVTVVHAVAALAPSYADLWAKANGFYKGKQYDSAVVYFEQIATSKPQDAVIYYNLGNAYYKLNNIPHAVLNYERALHINPDFQDAKDNLALTQRRIANNIQSNPDIFFVVWWRHLTAGAMAFTWAIAALVNFLLIMVLLVLRRLGKFATLPSQLTGVLFFTWVLFLFIGYVSANNKVKSNMAVVMLPDMPLMNGEQKGKPISLVPEGTTVEIRSEHMGWVEVRLPDGKTGWLQQSGVTLID